MARRRSLDLYSSQLVPDIRKRGQRACAEKALREVLRRTIAVELVAGYMLTDQLTQKAAVQKAAIQTRRNPAALEKLFKQNKTNAITRVATRPGSSDSIRVRANKLLDHVEHRRHARR